ncbi:hypothetical protein LTR39_006846, partial [Cryomyces antarcticus]
MQLFRLRLTTPADIGGVFDIQTFKYAYTLGDIRYSLQPSFALVQSPPFHKMHCTPRLLAPGFWKRSLDEFKRQSNIAIKLEGIRKRTTPFPLIHFDDASSLEACKTISDADVGGFSHASLDYVPPSSSEPAHVRFHGNISLDLPPNRPEIQRTGYAAWRTKDRPPTLFGKSLWDIDPYRYLALRVKSDGRAYFVNLQTESIVPTDIHQHRL